MLRTATSRQRVCQSAGRRTWSRDRMGACRIAQGRRESCDIPKPRIRIGPSFLNDIAESNDTAECGSHRLPQTHERQFW